MLTSEDWIARGNLAEAERAARYPDDWVVIAGAWREAGDTTAARRCIATALDHAAGDHWPSVRAAEVLLQLGDRDAAVAAFARIEQQLRTGERIQAYRWTLLARSFRAVLGDETAVQRCIAAAAAMATTTSDLADLASGLAEFGEPARVIDVLERAEARAIAAGELRDLWGVAIAWQNVAENEPRARAALALAVTTSTDIGELTSFAIAWRSLFDDDAQIRAALARAETFATSAADWLAIAEAQFEGGRDDRTEPWDAEGVQRALDASVRAGPTPEQRSEISAAYRDWLGIDAAALAAPAVAPEHLAVSRRTLAGWSGREPRALLQRLCERLTDEQLDSIAGADYGMGFVKHQRALAEIRATGLLALPLGWHPREALELVRWGRGADVDHVARAFACTVLALAAGVHAPDHHISDVIAPLIDSAWALALDDELETLLVWLVEVVADDDAWPMLGLVLTRARRTPDDARLGALVDRMIAVEAAANSGTWPDVGWLFRTTNYHQSRELWHALAKQALAAVTQPHLVEVARLLAP